LLVTARCLAHLGRFFKKKAPALLVRAEGLEPPRLSSREPKSRASTNSATPATGGRPGGAAYITRNPPHH
jgi:hypothetical protein